MVEVEKKGPDKFGATILEEGTVDMGKKKERKKEKRKRQMMREADHRAVNLGTNITTARCVSNKKFLQAFSGFSYLPRYLFLLPGTVSKTVLTCVLKSNYAEIAHVEQLKNSYGTLLPFGSALL